MQDTGMQVARIFRVEKDDSKLKAFVDLCIADSFIIKGFRVVQGQDGLFVGMPQERGKDGKWYDTAFPTSKEGRQQVNQLVLSNYNGC